MSGPLSFGISDGFRELQSIFLIAISGVDTGFYTGIIFWALQECLKQPHVPLQVDSWMVLEAPAPTEQLDIRLAPVKAQPTAPRDKSPCSNFQNDR